MPTETELEGAILRLGPVLDLAAAAPLAGELMELRGRPVQVDASAAERLGALCLQVLLSGRATWSADGLPFAIVGASDSFAAAAAQLGAPLDVWFANVEPTP